MPAIKASQIRKHDMIDDHVVTEVTHVGHFRGEDGVSTLAGAFAVVVMRFDSEDGAYHQEVRTWFHGDEDVHVKRRKESKG
jgi:hypothetical protein